MTLPERLAMWESGSFPPSCRRCVDTKWRGGRLDELHIVSLRKCQTEARQAAKAKEVCGERAMDALRAHNKRSEDVDRTAVASAMMKVYIDPCVCLSRPWNVCHEQFAAGNARDDLTSAPRMQAWHGAGARSEQPVHGRDLGRWRARVLAGRTVWRVCGRCWKLSVALQGEEAVALQNRVRKLDNLFARTR